MQNAKSDNHNLQNCSLNETHGFNGFCQPSLKLLIQVSFTCIHFHYSMHTWADLRPTNYFDVHLPTPSISITCVERRLNTEKGGCPKMARPWGIGLVLECSMTGFEGNEHPLQMFQQMHKAQKTCLVIQLKHCHRNTSAQPASGACLYFLNPIDFLIDKLGFFFRYFLDDYLGKIKPPSKLCPYFHKSMMYTLIFPSRTWVILEQSIVRET